MSAQTEAPINLTRRQAEFLALAAVGCGRTEIAERCCVSVWTVQHTLDAAKRRLQANSLAHATVKAAVFGLILVDVTGDAAMSAYA